jgi:hypothetical protein
MSLFLLSRLHEDPQGRCGLRCLLKQFGETAGVLRGGVEDLHGGVGVSDKGIEVELLGNWTTWDEPGVCISTSSSAAGRNESGDGADGWVRRSTGSRWNTR